MPDSTPTSVRRRNLLDRLGRVRTLLGRVPVTRPQIDPKTLERERERRRPIATEVNRIYRTGPWLLASELSVAIGLLSLSYLTTHAPHRVTLHELAIWIGQQRTYWNAFGRLGLVLSVLLPILVTVVLASASRSHSEAEQAPRGAASVEVIKHALYYGLLLTGVLALFAALPTRGGMNPVHVVLGLAGAALCAFLGPLLRIEGTQKELAIANAKARARAALRSRGALRGDARAANLRAARLFRPSSARVCLLLMVALGAASSGAASALASVMSPPPSTAVGVAMAGWCAALVGLVSVVVLRARSMRRVTPEPKLRCVSTLMWAVAIFVHLAAAFLVLAGLAQSEPGNSAVGLWLGVPIVSLLIGDVMVIILDRSMLGSLLDYARLTAVARDALAQVDYLKEPDQSVLRASSPPRIHAVSVSANGSSVPSSSDTKP